VKLVLLKSSTKCNTMAVFEESWSWDQDLSCWWSQGVRETPCYDHHQNHSPSWKQPYDLECGRCKTHEN